LFLHDVVMSDSMKYNIDLFMLSLCMAGLHECVL